MRYAILALSVELLLGQVLQQFRNVDREILVCLRISLQRAGLGSVRRPVVWRSPETAYDRGREKDVSVPHDQYAVCRFGFVRYVQLGQVLQQSVIEEDDILGCLGSVSGAPVWVVEVRFSWARF